MKQPMGTAMAILVVVAIGVLAGASSASAATLEIAGVAQNKSVTLENSIAPSGSLLLTDTSGVTINTCTASTVKWATASPFTSTIVGGPISTLSWSSCSEGNTTVDAAGTFRIDRIGTTTNGTVIWNGAQFTIPSFFGPLTCTTSSADIGTLTGVAKTTEHGSLDINAVISCTVIGTAK